MINKNIKFKKLSKTNFKVNKIQTKNNTTISSNWPYILWFVFYFFMTFVLVGIFTIPSYAFLITIILYAISLLIAFSSIGETILRNKYKSKKIITCKDKDCLIPLFDEVYYSAKQFCPQLSKNIKLYLIEDLDINAYAMGRNTIAVTKGAMRALSSEELMSLIAHEFGHMAYGDTKASLLNCIGNGFFSIYFRFCYGIIGAFFGLAKYARRNRLFIVSALLKLPAYIIKGLVALFIIIGNLLLSINSKKAEFKADYFAFKIGYGEYLKDTLYFLEEAFPEQKDDITKLDYSSHPDIKERIAKLEQALFET